MLFVEHMKSLKMTPRFDADRRNAVVSELRRWRDERLDLVVPNKAISVDSDGQMLLDIDNKLYQVGDRHFIDYAMAEKHLDERLSLEPEMRGKLKVEVLGRKEGKYRLTKKARGHLLYGRLQIPSTYVNRQAKSENMDLIWGHLSQVMERDNRYSLVRILDGQVRAVLSSRYRPLDSYTMFMQAYDSVLNAGGEIWNARLSDDGFQMQASTDGVHDYLENYLKDRMANGDNHPVGRGNLGGEGEDFKFGGGGAHAGKDVYYPLLSVYNDEAGGGTCRLEFGTIRGACLNTMLLQHTLFELRHAGGDLTAKTNNYVFSQDTQQKIAAAEMAKIKDAAAVAFQPERLQEVVSKLAALHEDRPPESVEPRKLAQAVIGHNNLPKSLEDRLLENLLKEGDYSRYGLLQATTAVNHSLKDEDLNLAMQIEEAGGRILSSDTSYEAYINSGVKLYDRVKQEEDDLALV